MTDLRIVTLTSAVSLWQFLHEQPMPEKLLSGWSNLFSLALRKNVVKGSYRNKKSEYIWKEAFGVCTVYLLGCWRLQVCKCVEQVLTILSIHISVEWAVE